MTKSQYADLINLHSSVNNVIIYNNEPLLAFRRNINKNKYNVVLDLHKNIRSYILTIFSKFIVTRYHKETFKKLILVIFKINIFREIIPVFKKYLYSLKKLKSAAELNFSSSELKVDAKRIINDSYMVISPSSKHFTKTLPKEKFAYIIKKYFNKKIVLVGDDTDIDKEICKFLSNISKNVLNYCGKTNYSELANILYYAELVLCNDSGVLHLAESLGKKVIVFFGSTVKEFGFYPQLKSTLIFENINLKCRPCTHIGKSYCPKKHFRCMNELNIDDIKLI